MSTLPDSMLFLASLERDMSAMKLPEPPPKDHNAELHRAYSKIGQLKKELREASWAKEEQIRCLQNEIKNLKRQIPAYNTRERAWQEIRRLRKLAFYMKCILEGVPYAEKNAVNDLRRVVWNTYVLKMNMGDRVQCCHCGKLLLWEDFTVEHLKPKILGGGNELSNLRPACAPCNYSRPVEDISGRFNT